MITKHQIIINYIEEISLKSDAKNKIFSDIKQNYCNLSANLPGHDHKTTN